MRVINLISTGQFLNQVVACGCIKPSVVSAYPWRSSRMRPLQQRVLQIWYVLRVILRQDWYFASAPPPGLQSAGHPVRYFSSKLSMNTSRLAHSEKPGRAPYFPILF